MKTTIGTTDFANGIGVKKTSLNIPLMVLLILTLLSTGLIPADTGYKILSFKGTVKVKCSDKFITLLEAKDILLDKEHALMLYSGASIEILFPNGNRETFYGPFYATVSTLQKPFSKQQLAFFGEEKIWKAIQRIFEEEEEIQGTSRSGSEDRNAFRDEIDQRLTDHSLADPTLPADKIIELNQALEAVDPMYNGFSTVRRIIIKALVYRQFGLNKKALETIMVYYQSIAHQPDAKIVRGQVEDYVYTEFLPIIITIGPQSDVDREVAGFHRTFTANFKLWWAAFYYDGEELIEIEKTIDNQQHPQNTFTVHKNFDLKKSLSPNCIFIVVCPEWTELESYDNIRSAKNILLTKTIRETKVNTVKDYGKVTIKLCQ